MPERLDRVTIALNRGNITISWDARQALLIRLQHIQSTSRIRATFDAVGATRPVELNPGQKVALVKMLEEWWDEGTRMPLELAALHDARHLVPPNGTGQKVRTPRFAQPA